MSTANLNVSVGIDVGSHTLKLVGDDKIIAAVPGFDLLCLREEAEIYFDEPVFSCVIAASDYSDRRQRELKIAAKRAGFKNIEIISSHEAILNNFENKNEKILACDFGASRSEIIFFNEGQVIDNEIISDVCGNEFDKIFASWLSERFTLNLINEKDLLAQAEKFKQELSLNEKISWRGVDVFREDFERLVHFSIKRASHTVERFINCYSPKKIIMTGGCVEIPALKKIFSDLSPKIEFNKNLIVLGAAKKANSLSGARERAKRLDSAAKLKEIRNEIITLEDLLTRKQKDRLYGLFRQIEAAASGVPALIKLLENLINEIKAKGSSVSAHSLFRR